MKEIPLKENTLHQSKNLNTVDSNFELSNILSIPKL